MTAADDRLVEPVAFRPDAARRGHVESFFVKANAPDGARALWLKWTIFAARGAEAPRAECWAVWFERGARPQAFKRSAPLDPPRMLRAPLALDFDGARFDGRRARGAIEGARAAIAWDVVLAPRVPPLRQLPFGWMYRAPFPESKLTSPVPDAVAAGHVAVGGARVELAGWRAMWGHNWGTRHAHRYAWCHAGGFDGADDVVFEGVSARLRKAGVELPWLTLAYLWTDGAWRRFDLPRAMARARTDAGVLRWRFETAAGDYRLRGDACARPEEAVGLHYANPGGDVTYCLNSKLARLSLELAGPSGTRVLTTSRAALELGWPSADHGVAMMA